MRAHREFTHPNLMPLLDWALFVVENGDAAFLLFPLMEGTYLLNRRVLGGGPPMEEPEILGLFAGICKGVGALHNHSPSWAHRDIKPENVMLTCDNSPVIMDFGSMAPAERVSI
ncbi:unnamed protein product [Choristocarpus tenellus]